MFYVYFIESLTTHGQRHGGFTANLKQRFQAHNPGKSAPTSKYLPWQLVTYIAFFRRAKAESFERYLKSGSGHALAANRLW